MIFDVSAFAWWTSLSQCYSLERLSVLSFYCNTETHTQAPLGLSRLSRVCTGVCPCAGRAFLFVPSTPMTRPSTLKSW